MTDDIMDQEYLHRLLWRRMAMLLQDYDPEVPVFRAVIKDEEHPGNIFLVIWPADSHSGLPVIDEEKRFKVKISLEEV